MKIISFFIITMSLFSAETKLKFSYSAPMSLSSEQDVGFKKFSVETIKTTQTYVFYANYMNKSFLDSYSENNIKILAGFHIIHNLYILSGGIYKNFQMPDIDVYSSTLDYVGGSFYSNNLFNILLLKGKNYFEANLKFFGIFNKSLEFELNYKKNVWISE